MTAAPIIFDCQQRTEEWIELRLGKVTASRIQDVLAEIKKGEAASRRNYRAELVVETLTGLPAESAYISNAMQWGIDTEPFARAAYELETDISINTTGFAVHPEIERFGASPDGLIGDMGLVEIKCPNTATHLEYLLGGSVPTEYGAQMFAAMACTGREWCDFVSYDPRLPEHLRLFVRRLYRDEGIIRKIEMKVQEFLDEVDQVISRLAHGGEL